MCLLICYEHSQLSLMQRLLCTLSWLAGDPAGGVGLALIRETLGRLAEDGKLDDLSSVLLRLRKSGLLGWRQMESCLDTLYLYRGDSVYTSLEAIDKAAVVLQRRGLHPVGIVDWAQRVHTLRHTFATHHIAMGTDLVTVQEFLGHRSLDTTKIYIGLAKKRQAQHIQEHAL